MLFKIFWHSRESQEKKMKGGFFSTDWGIKKLNVQLGSLVRQ